MTLSCRPSRLWVIVALTTLGPSALAAQACGAHCGTERWAVKTFTDADTARVDLTPRAGTVLELRALARPDLVSELRRSPLELRTYRIRALLLGWKHERDDDDFHLVVADSAHPEATMIVEIPSAACARVCSSRLVNEMRAARDSAVSGLGRPSDRYRRLRPPRMVTVTGILFFDFLHGQTGVAPNGVELHPVLGLTFGAGPGPGHTDWYVATSAAPTHESLADSALSIPLAEGWVCTIGPAPASGAARELTCLHGDERVTSSATCGAERPADRVELKLGRREGEPHSWIVLGCGPSPGARWTGRRTDRADTTTP